MELGKGYAFVARQQHIHTEKQDYYIDLVFYNYILKCFVLIGLKTEKISHADVEQMDMYIRMYDELKRGEGDNPTIGIVLCSDTDEDIARYSVMHGNEQLFASNCKLYLPTEEEYESYRGISPKMMALFMEDEISRESKVAPDTTGADKYFIDGFITEEMEYEFWTIASDFMEHHFPRLKEFDDLATYGSYGPE